jgi:hypothetical protein
VSPKHGRIFHMAFALCWSAQAVAVLILMWPFDWKLYLIEISLWANIATHLSGYSAERPTEILEETKGGDTK